MTKKIPLKAVASQSLTLVLDGHTYDITLREANGIMAVDIAVNGVTVVSGRRCLPGYPLIPFAYQYAGMGNFVFSTEGDAYPYFTEFGVTCFLNYYSRSEIDAGA
ncbi:phage baseplate plug protein [Limnohabitans sp.]|uniref:phage baseplate plug family protein n=1 Tax=Limnohabitans sp. TaxID=1907725 RepID=UPI00286EBB8F|nr:hypothetical protein [Limnohabitans sp.]